MALDAGLQVQFCARGKPGGSLSVVTEGMAGEGRERACAYRVRAGNAPGVCISVGDSHVADKQCRCHAMWLGTQGTAPSHVAPAWALTARTS